MRPTQTKKVYKTMQGRTIDIDRLRAQNEDVYAVGNMKVNARGDMIGNGGQIVKTKEQIMKDYYEKPKGVVSDAVEKMPVDNTTPAEVVETKILNQEVIKQPQVQTKTVKTFKPKEEAHKSGIDAALDGIE